MIRGQPLWVGVGWDALGHFLDRFGADAVFQMEYHRRGKGDYTVMVTGDGGPVLFFTEQKGVREVFVNKYAAGACVDVRSGKRRRRLGVGDRFAAYVRKQYEMRSGWKPNKEDTDGMG